MVKWDGIEVLLKGYEFNQVSHEQQEIPNTQNNCYDASDGPWPCGLTVQILNKSSIPEYRSNMRWLAAMGCYEVHYSPATRSTTCTYLIGKGMCFVDGLPQYIINRKPNLVPISHHELAGPIRTTLRSPNPQQLQGVIL